jgi:ABC-type branched-subunit amino acid transport system substrate-binding protein
MKKFTKIISLALALVLSLGVLAACGGDKEVKLSTDVYEGDVIWVGNTAGTTGALASIGVPFNLGIESAFAEYNKNGGFNGKTVALKHYDDEGTATNSVPLMEKLIFEDEIFAVVGNYGGYAVNVNLDILKENCVPMIYAAAGIDALYNGNATTDGDRCISPYSPLIRQRPVHLLSVHLLMHLMQKAT